MYCGHILVAPETIQEPLGFFSLVSFFILVHLYVKKLFVTFIFSELDILIRGQLLVWDFLNVFKRYCCLGLWLKILKFGLVVMALTHSPFRFSILLCLCIYKKEDVV